jgi:hypothetical protein
VEIVILSGHHTWDGLEETLMRSYAFICCHDHGDELRECSTCVLLSYLLSPVRLRRKYSRVMYNAMHALA